jgi:hypothetical protein
LYVCAGIAEAAKNKVGAHERMQIKKRVKLK